MSISIVDAARVEGDALHDWLVVAFSVPVASDLRLAAAAVARSAKVGGVVNIAVNAGLSL